MTSSIRIASMGSTLMAVLDPPEPESSKNQWFRLSYVLSPWLAICNWMKTVWQSQLCCSISNNIYIAKYDKRQKIMMNL